MASWFYGPDGQSGVFDTCPEGWADHPCKCELVHRSGMRRLEGDELEAAKAAITDAQAQIAAMDGDGDGRIGGSLPKSKRKPRKAVSDGNRN